MRKVTHSPANKQPFKLQKAQQPADFCILQLPKHFTHTTRLGQQMHPPAGQGQMFHDLLTITQSYEHFKHFNVF